MSQSVAQYISAWLDLRAPSLAPSTVSGYRRCLRLHIAPVAGAVPLADLTPAHVMAVLSPLCAAGHTRQAQLVRILLRCALQDAVRMGLLLHNPADAVRPPAHHQQPIAYWSREQISAFLASQRFSPLSHVWLLALLCGLRRGELLGLRWSDVDLHAGVATICNQRMVIERVCIGRSTCSLTWTARPTRPNSCGMLSTPPVLSLICPVCTSTACGTAWPRPRWRPE